MSVIRRPVKRVDYPLVPAVLTCDDRVSCFFGQDRVSRNMRLDPFDDQRLRGKICFGNKIDVALFRDALNSSELLK